METSIQLIKHFFTSRRLRLWVTNKMGNTRESW